ncbi:hypothetical protein CQ14_19505 [Bradyrhizobium lablabi]|uniref:Uncharacterized protein n=1 Tax=Bradyrhizobium lablabi TaxID=722472 RepID=A0A0R3N177_9BRAD|nr:hypothetical protein CQ14_19505 [Bradyrhizobium lablabi]
MTDVVCGVVDGIDMGKTDEPHDEEAESHGNNSLVDHAQVMTGDRQAGGGTSLLHVGSPR